MAFEPLPAGTDNPLDAVPVSWQIEKYDLVTDEWVVLRHFAKNCSISFPEDTLYDSYDLDVTAYQTVLCQQYYSEDQALLPNKVSTDD